MVAWPGLRPIPGLERDSPQILNLTGQAKWSLRQESRMLIGSAPFIGCPEAGHQVHRDQPPRGRRDRPGPRPPGPPARGGGPSRSSGWSTVLPFLSRVFRAAGALAISLASITPSWLASRATKTGANGRRPPGPPCRPMSGAPNPPCASGPGPPLPRPPGPPPRGGGPRRSPGYSTVLPSLSKVLRAAGALAISPASITPSWLASRARNMGRQRRASAWTAWSWRPVGAGAIGLRDDRPG